MTKIVAIEGADKVGKQTQTTMLVNTLGRYGDKVKLVEVPFRDGATHKLIYWMLANGMAKRFPHLFQFVHFVNKFIFQFTYLVWLRLTHDVIVLDRWALSSIVYGDATGVNKLFNRFLYWFLISPDVTIILHGPSFKRDEKADDVYEKDSDLQSAVKSGYYDWANEHPENHELIDNQGAKDEVASRVLMIVENS